MHIYFIELRVDGEKVQVYFLVENGRRIVIDMQNGRELSSGELIWRKAIHKLNPIVPPYLPPEKREEILKRPGVFFYDEIDSLNQYTRG